ncbi:SCO6745 family protein [Streptomyces spiramenti]|uniref:SalK n=1 Tax=Streptomyces spiramenti TaxID=2720606 RepID=A0ABX1AF04_9ACTN|nr:hypothetical protein [Streptomyces spiramenti]NJP65782.1 hypothetical protein [Streptomyces spiramenti]
MTSPPSRAGRHCHAALNPLHSLLYFSPELPREMAALGIGEQTAAYLATRAAPLGRVGAGAVSAVFYSFRPGLVARHLPAVWERARPDAVIEARLRAADGVLRRLLGDRAVESPQMAEAAELALRAATGCRPHGRPLYAANADLAIPHDPHLRLWHAATLLREHRGDGHVAVLLREGLDPAEAMISHAASGHGQHPAWLRETRGWSEQEWNAAQGRLRDRGLLAADGRLTEDGVALRKAIENETDRLDRAPYETLGADDVARLTDLAAGFALTAAKAGAFPSEVMG